MITVGELVETEGTSKILENFIDKEIKKQFYDDNNKTNFKVFISTNEFSVTTIYTVLHKYNSFTVSAALYADGVEAIFSTF